MQESYPSFQDKSDERQVYIDACVQFLDALGFDAAQVVAINGDARELRVEYFRADQEGYLLVPPQPMKAVVKYSSDFGDTLE